MATPLWNLLRQLEKEHPLRMDMPGHHGRPLPMKFPWPSRLDFTENGRTGNLYGSEPDAISEAEALWAKAMGMDTCLFLTGGSTLGLHAGLTMLAPPGSRILLDRCSHRCLYSGMALLDLRPVPLLRPWLQGEGVYGPVDPESVDAALQAAPNVKTVCITSPSYYGVLSDLPAIAQVCHRHGARLLVDGAHGAHLPFLGYTGYQAADVVVVSTHKTLAAPGQTALLLANGFPLEELQRAAALHGTSSPSYVMMAALDALRQYMTDGTGKKKYRHTASRTALFRKNYPSLQERPGLSLDPTRLTLLQRDGDAMASRLRDKGIYPELADRGHVVLILTDADSTEDCFHLNQALCEETWLPPSPLPPAPMPMPMPVPAPAPAQTAETDGGRDVDGDGNADGNAGAGGNRDGAGGVWQRLTPREALFAPHERVPLAQAAGRIAASPIAPYPPGVPVVAPGEEITEKTLAYLRKIGYNEELAEVVRTPTGKKAQTCAD